MNFNNLLRWVVGGLLVLASFIGAISLDIITAPQASGRSFFWVCNTPFVTSFVPYLPFIFIVFILILSFWYPKQACFLALGLCASLCFILSSSLGTINTKNTDILVHLLPWLVAGILYGLILFWPRLTLIILGLVTIAFSTVVVLTVFINANINLFIYFQWFMDYCTLQVRWTREDLSFLLDSIYYEKEMPNTGRTAVWCVPFNGWLRLTIEATNFIANEFVWNQTNFSLSRTQELIPGFLQELQFYRVDNFITEFNENIQRLRTETDSTYYPVWLWKLRRWFTHRWGSVSSRPGPSVSPADPSPNSGGPTPDDPSPDSGGPTLGGEFSNNKTGSRHEDWRTDYEWTRRQVQKEYRKYKLEQLRAEELKIAKQAEREAIADQLERARLRREMSNERQSELEYLNAMHSLNRDEWVADDDARACRSFLNQERQRAVEHGSEWTRKRRLAHRLWTRQATHEVALADDNRRRVDLHRESEGFRSRLTAPVDIDNRRPDSVEDRARAERKVGATVAATVDLEFNRHDRIKAINDLRQRQRAARIKTWDQRKVDLSVRAAKKKLANKRD